MSKLDSKIGFVVYKRRLVIECKESNLYNASIYIYKVVISGLGHMVVKFTNCA